MRCGAFLQGTVIEGEAPAALLLEGATRAPLVAVKMEISE